MKQYEAKDLVPGMKVSVMGFAPPGADGPLNVCVKMVVNYGTYNAGETCWFQRSLAQDLIDKGLGRRATFHDLSKPACKHVLTNLEANPELLVEIDTSRPDEPVPVHYEAAVFKEELKNLKSAFDKDTASEILKFYGIPEDGRQRNQQHTDLGVVIMRKLVKIGELPDNPILHDQHKALADVYKEQWDELLLRVAGK